jgi:hypothetical protein
LKAEKAPLKPSLDFGLLLNGKGEVEGEETLGLAIPFGL